LCDAKAAHRLAWVIAQKVVADNTAGTHSMQQLWFVG
jgi:hypothetical protein